MYEIRLDGEELRIVRQALESYLEAFGHEEADIVRRTQAVIARIDSVRESSSGSAS